MGLADEADRISGIMLKKFPELESVELSSLWENNRVILMFFRRFGCIFCRNAAKEVSQLKPLLDEHNVKLVGIGMEATGLDDFFKAGYFAGEVYLDEKQETYKALGYKSYGYIGMIASIFSRSSISTARKCNAENIKGDYKGNGFRNGGVLVLEQGGTSVLLSYKQENPADHPANQDILSALGIKEPVLEVSRKSEDSLITVKTESTGLQSESKPISP